MTTGALATILRAGFLATALILGPAPGLALAHGIDVTAALESNDGPVATHLELTEQAAPVAIGIESDTTESDSTGPNVPLIFGIGATLGIAIAVIRNRLR